MENENKIDKIFDREDIELFTNIKEKLKTIGDLSELVIITGMYFHLFRF